MRATLYGTTYYIHSHDGKLLAEYDGTGACVKDYIYMGNRLIAEYQPAIGKYYYYTSDQINSTRIITDSSGSVVYSAVSDPYGGMQKQWVNAFNPSLKFPGKERQAGSEAGRSRQRRSGRNPGAATPGKKGPRPGGRGRGGKGRMDEGRTSGRNQSLSVSVPGSSPSGGGGGAMRPGRFIRAPGRFGRKFRFIFSSLAICSAVSTSRTSSR